MAAPRPTLLNPARNLSGQAKRRFRHRSESARQRDVLHHLQPWHDMYKPAALYRDAFPQAPDVPPPSTREPCPDTTLAALAQLCALRMQVRTCLVTLVSHDREFVLADMTQSTPLQQSAGRAKAAPAWLGTTSFSSADGTTMHALEEWGKARRGREAPPEDDHYYTEELSPHWLMFPDCRRSHRARDARLLQQAPWIRFYCAVPLRGAQGSILGSLTILDDKPRYGVSADELTLMEDLSDTIVEHLNANIVREQWKRSERFIQGLGLFNAGENSLRDWWMSQEDTKLLGTGRNVERGTVGDREDRADVEFGILDRPDAPMSNLGHGSQDALPGASRTNHKTSAGDATCTSPSTNRHSPDEVPEAQSTTPRTNKKRPGPNPKQSPDAHFDVAAAIAAVYARASNLLREALGANGVVITNADAATASLQRSGPHDNDSSDSSTDGIQQSEILAFSTSTRSSFGGHQPNGAFNLPRRSHHRLISRYPNGSTFYVDRGGEVHKCSDNDTSHSSGDGLAAGQATNQRHKRDRQICGQIVPGVRTALFLPMSDESNERWRSCIFAWSTSDKHMLTQPEDLAYLRTFGHCIMAELARLESKAADFAKGSFISSISHELRSPLHGILAGVEFLNETELTAFQSDMSRIIDTAGRTLLDTVNHILDYSKISAVTRAHKSTPSPDGVGKTSSFSEQKKPVADLSRLTEEIIETCVVAHRSQVQSSTPSQIDFDHEEAAQTLASPEQSVAVTLNIARRKLWTTDVHPGAWARILTNVVGNALKFTSHGSIAVRLDVTEPVRHNHATSTGERVRLVVEDTGIGMSESFLAQIFTPFRQENPHSAGTGLGLSIVRNIVREIDGELDVVSKKGHGTKITLRFMATFLDQSFAAVSNGVEDSMADGFGRLGIDAFYIIGSSDSDSDATVDTAVVESVGENANEWLNCPISHNTSITQSSISGKRVFAITEQKLSGWRANSPEKLADFLDITSDPDSRVIILADTIKSSNEDLDFGGLSFNGTLATQPIGPRKLLWAIAASHDGAQSDERSAEARIPPRIPLSRAGTFQRLSVKTSSTPKAQATERGKPTSSSTRSRDASTGSIESPARGSSDVSSPNADLTPCSISNETSQFSVSGSVARSNSSAMPSPMAQGSTNSGDMVLLVEDNEVNMKLLVALMQKNKLQYRCAVNGQEAVAFYRQNPHAYFLVLMDMSMPIMDGFTATAKIRELEHKRHIPRKHICALTGVTSAEAKARAFACGVDEFYSKPVKIQELRALLTRLQDKE